MIKEIHSLLIFFNEEIHCLLTFSVEEMHSLLTVSLEEIHFYFVNFCDYNLLVLMFEYPWRMTFKRKQLVFHLCSTEVMDSKPPGHV